MNARGTRQRMTLCGVLVLSLGAEVLVHPQVHFSWQSVPFFSALYGFVGCIMIILGSKALGHYWLQKEEDYYKKH